MIELNNIRKAFGDNQVLRGIDFSCNKGETVVILGASGSGKTTLLRCINFLEKADAGTMKLADSYVDFQKAGKKEILDIRKKTAFVFQAHNLFNNKTVLENVTEGLITGRKMPKTEAVAIARQALDKVGLSDKYDFYPGKLSGGQQQRVGIARAVVTNPEVILFDEPTSALDPELVGETLKLLAGLSREGITMIVVTHEMAFAKAIASKVVFLEGGEIVEEAPPGEFFEAPKTERAKKFLAMFEYESVDFLNS